MAAIQLLIFSGIASKTRYISCFYLHIQAMCYKQTDPRGQDAEEDFDQHNPRSRITVTLWHLRARTSVWFDDCIVQVIHLSSRIVTSVVGIKYHCFRLGTKSFMTALTTWLKRRRLVSPRKRSFVKRMDQAYERKFSLTKRILEFVLEGTLWREAAICIAAIPFLGIHLKLCHHQAMSPLRNPRIRQVPSRALGWHQDNIILDPFKAEKGHSERGVKVSTLSPKHHRGYTCLKYFASRWRKWTCHTTYTAKRANVSASSVMLSPDGETGGIRSASNKVKWLDEGRHPAWSRSAVTSTKTSR